MTIAFFDYHFESQTQASFSVDDLVGYDYLHTIYKQEIMLPTAFVSDKAGEQPSLSETNVTMLLS